MQNNIIFRWSVGQQDTSLLNQYADQEYDNFLWLTKLSIISFQKWFINSDFYILYNGNNFNDFKKRIDNLSPHFINSVNLINQKEDKYVNKYKFHPLSGGVWMKWIPFRIDINKTEIAVDTDVICINNPSTWIEWINDLSSPLIVAPERLKRIEQGSCGDFFNHVLLKNKNPINCGVVGQKAGHSYEDRFFEIAEMVQYGGSHNSFFITEQGAINLWIYSLEAESVNHTVLDFQKNTWCRDFCYFLFKGVKVETIHAVAWQKRIMLYIKPFIEKKVVEGYEDHEFLSDILSNSKMLPEVIKLFFAKQIRGESDMFHDFLLQDGSNFKN